MYLKDGKFFIDGKNCIYFDNLIFIRNESSSIRIIKHKDHNLSINFNIVNIDNKFTFVADITDTFFVFDKPHVLQFGKSTKYNKKVLLKAIKEFIDIYYNAFLLAKEHNINLDVKDFMYMPDDNQFDKTHIMLLSYIRSISEPNNFKKIFIHYDCDNKCNSIIVHQSVYNTNRLTDNNKISFHNNILRITNFSEVVTIYYSKDFLEKINFHINKEIDKEIGLDWDLRFDRCYNNISGSNNVERRVYINYAISPHLLFKFFNNIDVFKNLDNFIINSEYDLIKYL